MQTLQCRQLHQLGVPGGGSWLLPQLQQACAHRWCGVGAVGGDQGGAAFAQVCLHHAVDQFDAAQVEVGVGFVEQPQRSEEHTSELQSLMRVSYAVLCLKKKTSTTKRIM